MTPISVEERVPEDKERVLVYEMGIYSMWFTAWRCNRDMAGKDWLVEGMPDFFDPVITHWMPLTPHPTHE